MFQPIRLGVEVASPPTNALSPELTRRLQRPPQQGWSTRWSAASPHPMLGKADEMQAIGVSTQMKDLVVKPQSPNAAMHSVRASGLAGELVAEFFGTFIMILLGVGAVAQVAAGKFGGHDSIAWAWGFGVMLGLYVAGRISGGHLNPAVSVALALYQKFPWRKVLPYSAAQIAGAFVAALVVRWNYTEVIDKLDPGHTIKTQGIFSTLPGDGTAPVSDLGALRDQIIVTAILVFLIFVITDPRNSAPLANLAPLIVGLMVVGMVMGWGTDGGYAINPARDLGPRVASYLTGYRGAFRDQYGHLYFWVPILGPILGGAIGGALYKYGVQRSLPCAQASPSISGCNEPSPSSAAADHSRDGATDRG
jgi:glycerol uptake facilitator protein